MTTMTLTTRMWSTAGPEAWVLSFFFPDELLLDPEEELAFFAASFRRCQPKTNKSTMQQSAVYPKRSRKMLPEQRGRCHGCPKTWRHGKAQVQSLPCCIVQKYSQIDMTTMRESSTKAQRNTRILSKRGTTQMGPKYVPIYSENPRYGT